jgi:riboflavin kinase/FMN adenylyltransferase
MKIIKEISEFKEIEKGCVLTIGNFDGVHLGHRQILNAAKQAAQKGQTQLIAMTFEPHPLAVLFPEKAPKILTPLSLKKELLAEIGIDYLFISKSTPGLLNLSAVDFVQRFLVENIQPSIVVEGQSFNFGSKRSGNAQILKELGIQKGFEVSIIQAKEVKLSTGQSVKVSSTIIRNLLMNGEVSDAAIALGRPYRLIGRIVLGKGKGRQLGFPTLNMESPKQLIPTEGVYAGRVEIGDNTEQVLQAKQKIPAVFSIGRTQTFGRDCPFLIEAHTLDKNPGQAYNKWLAMDFIKHIRPQQKFETEKDLSAQIAKDCEKAKEILDFNLKD